MSIKILKKTTDEVLELSYKTFVFSGGEVSVKLDANNLKFLQTPVPVILVARIQTSEDFVRLAMIKDALEKLDEYFVFLILPYVPYARQDRVCANGESFSLKVFTDLLNSLKFSEVTILDPHSDVTPALINNVKVVSQLNIISRTHFNERLCKPNIVFCSPDAGANKKTSELAKYFQHEGFIRADKLRDLTNGNIKETIVYADDLTGKTVVIADDLIDAGGTFIGLTKELKKKKADKVILYVTHGIFSKGVDILFQNGIDEIWCTDSFREDIDTKVNVLKIEDIKGVL